MNGSFACTSVCASCAYVYLQRPEDCDRCPGIGVIGACYHLFGCWESNPNNIGIMVLTTRPAASKRLHFHLFNLQAFNWKLCHPSEHQKEFFPEVLLTTHSLQDQVFPGPLSGHLQFKISLALPRNLND